jgi:hypothetical protein
VDVRAESREARLEVRRQLRAAALEPRVARDARKTAKHWYRPELVPAEVGFRGDFVE